MSTSIDQVLSIYLDELNGRLEELFSDTDDHLFDKSSKSDDSRHFAAMRTLRMKKLEVLKSFSQGVRNEFVDSIGKIEGAALFGECEEEISFENLALVEEDDLEERIALESMTNKAQKANKQALTNIRQRLDVLVPSVAVTDEINPFDPSCICTAISQSLSSIDLGTEFKLVLYKFFERTVIDEMDLIYDKVNQFFIENGILPDLKSVAISHDRRRRRTQSSDNGQEKSEQSTKDSDEILNLLGELLSQRRGEDSQRVSQQVDTGQLVAVLSNLQAHTGTTLENDLRDIRSQIGALLPGNVGGQVTQGALGQANDDMIDVVTMLFDFILDDDNLHAEIKAVIARLQIPILKVGLTDRTFFSNRKHPARLLLNELAHAGLSWEPDDNSAAPMLSKIQGVVEKICNEYTEQPNFFEQLLEDFIAFKNDFRRRANIFEKRTKEAEEGKAKAETARSKVNEQIKRICARKNVPEVARQILKNVWVHVMFLESLKEDKEGWEKVSKIAQMLIWSLQPVKDQARLDKLIKVVPVLVKNIKLGFDKISFSQLDASALMDKLEDAHRTIISEGKVYIEESQKDEIIRLMPVDPFTQGSATQETVSTSEAEEEIEEVVVEEIAFSEEEIGKLHTPKPKVKITEDSKATVENFSAGSWFDLKIDEEYRRCKLAARIVSTGKYIFVNRAGVKVSEFFTDELAAAYQLGEIKVLDDEALFDRALKAVISNLRDMKAEA
nr:DUF1631 domain-containing protein [Aliikangiella sp. G2MR2-5]